MNLSESNQAKKKLLFFGDLPPKYLDGISISSRTNLELLADHYEVVIVEEENDFSKHESAALSKFGQIYSKLRELKKKFKTEKPDIFYLTYSVSTLGALKTLGCIIRAKMNSNARIVLHIHRGDFFKSFYVSFINKLTTKFVFGLVNKIIVLSNGQKKEFEEVIPQSKYRVLENTIQEEFEFQGGKKSNKTFLFISNYLKEKGIFDLLEVFKELTKEDNSIKLITYGRFPNDALEKEVRAYASDQIIINGAIRGKEKFEQMHKADALILPSWNEGQPITILEALSVKTPVLVSNVGLIPEMLDAEYPYLFEAQNRKELKTTVLKYIRDDQKIKLGEKLYKRYTKDFSRNSHQRKILEIFAN